MKKMPIGGILDTKGLTMIRVFGIPNKPGYAGILLTQLGEEGINLQFIAESEDIDGFGNITLCVSADQAEKALSIVNEHKEEYKSKAIKSINNITALTIYGPHFREKPAICGKVCAALGLDYVNIYSISTSISSVCCLISDDDFESAYENLLTVFELP